MRRLGTRLAIDGAPRRWRQLLSLFGTPARPRTFAEEALWLHPSSWASADVRMPSTPSLVVVSVKFAPLSWWVGTRLPSDVGFIHVPFPAERRSSRLIAQVVPRDIPLVFLGDLDPPSVVQYAATRLALPPAVQRRFRYGGVDSEWLMKLQPALRARFPLERLRIPLSPAEKRLLRHVEGAIDLEGLLGAPAASMLRDGFKLELEGAIRGSTATVARHGYSDCFDAAPCARMSREPR